MKTNNKDIQYLIDYLSKNLCGRGLRKFHKVGPRTFFYADDIDTIFVKVTDENLIIITDGENVIDGMSMHRILGEIAEEEVADFYLQRILEMF